MADKPHNAARLCCLALAAAALCLIPADKASASGDADNPKAGLMWNRTGLPAVFPLQVKTREGADYFLVLSDAATGKDALAAFIKGGAFFRVLVPPGTYDLRLAAGRTWQGEDGLFGPGARTQHIALEQQLTFKTRGLGVKRGHIVDLTRIGDDGIEASVRTQAICQTASTGALLPEFPLLEDKWEDFRGRGAWIETYSKRFSFPDERLEGTPLYPVPYAYYPEPRPYSLRSYYCG